MTWAVSGEFLVPVDFNVLYRTDELSVDFLTAFGRHVGAPYEQMLAETRSPKLKANKLGGYDLDAHIVLHGEDSDAIWGLYEEVSQSSDYLYEDGIAYVAEMIALGLRPWILSYGLHKVQEKQILPCSAALFDIRYEVINIPKREHLAHAYRGSMGALADNEPHQALPDGFHEIHVDRSRDASRRWEEGLGGFIVADMHQAIEVVRLLLRAV